MVLGYFLYESAVLGYGLGAVGGVPANLLQAAGGALLAVLLLRALTAVPQSRLLFEEKEGEVYTSVMRFCTHQMYSQLVPGDVLCCA